ncbi:DUF86 domain-containing protein [Patescibacteria group bacterium AH-259-L05]|nr:DUF86 domain-containing protein [Patescibacteria group bacterium AH-259-L05]
MIENKISSVEKYLSILNSFKKYSVEEIKQNITIKGSLERYLYLAVQATIDLAEAVISLKKFRKPTTLSENFYILNEEKIISNKLTEQLAKMTGFRNIIAHDYEQIDYDIVYDTLQNRLKDIKKFISLIKNKI